jgi:hypothetical protein
MHNRGGSGDIHRPASANQALSLTASFCDEIEQAFRLAAAVADSSDPPERDRLRLAGINRWLVQEGFVMSFYEQSFGFKVVLPEGINAHLSQNMQQLDMEVPPQFSADGVEVIGPEKSVFFNRNSGIYLVIEDKPHQLSVLLI